MLHNIGTAIFIFIASGIILAMFNNWLPVWFCHKLNWHLQPKKIDSKCPRCDKKVSQDSQGNWS